MGASGVLDAADALDLEHAVIRTATGLTRLGCAESVQVRRSLAVGEIARAQASLDLVSTSSTDKQGHSTDAACWSSSERQRASVETTTDS